MGLCCCRNGIYTSSLLHIFFLLPSSSHFHSIHKTPVVFRMMMMPLNGIDRRMVTAIGSLFAFFSVDLVKSRLMVCRVEVGEGP